MLVAKEGSSIRAESSKTLCTATMLQTVGDRIDNDIRCNEVRLWQLHPIAHNADSRWNQPEVADFGTVRAAKEVFRFSEHSRRSGYKDIGSRGLPYPGYYTRLPDRKPDEKAAVYTIMIVGCAVSQYDYCSAPKDPSETKSRTRLWFDFSKFGSVREPRASS